MSRFYIPDGNFELHSGDRIGIVGAPAEITKFLKNISMLKKQAKGRYDSRRQQNGLYLAKNAYCGGSFG